MVDYKILHSDCISALKKMKQNSIDSVVTDPPYELGFMGKSWDATQIAFSVEMWVEVLRVLKPGGHLLAFSHTRTYHRMVVAIEDAGFEIRDQIMWVYGSGFPKSHNIGKNIEKINVGGIKNLKKIGVKKGIKVETGTQGYSYSKEYVAGKSMGGKQINGDIPVYEINNDWEGWGTALKPAHEPIVLARKPLVGTVANNVLTWGVGGLNIDGSRIATNENLNGGAYAKSGIARDDGWGMQRAGAGEYEQPQGRFPANFIHDGSDEVVELFPDTGKSTGGRIGKKSMGDVTNVPAGEFQAGDPGYGDSGSAARFFYCAKTSKRDRNEGLDGFEAKKNSKMYRTANNTSETISKGFERFDTAPQSNNHPTVKPTSLMRYLVRLITPPHGTVLDPFMGSGSTGKACMYENFNFVGIDMIEEYVEISKARIEFAKKESAKMALETEQTLF
jgi:DNA modification methylase